MLPVAPSFPHSPASITLGKITLAQGLSPPAIGPDAALFLDFDGTLADLAPRPDGVHLDAGTITALTAIAEALDGAVAIVSGRPIREIDDFLAPLWLPVAGVHGFERRSGQGRNHAGTPGDPATVAAVTEAVRAFAREDPRLVAEVKRAAVALHYRQAPERADACIAAVERLADAYPNVNILHGKYVVEAKFSASSKGTAIRDFMKEPPFAGRKPVFIGDDVTDEEGFKAVQELGGVGIKVGEGETAAMTRLAGPAEVRTWLGEAAGRLPGAGPAKAGGSSG